MPKFSATSTGRLSSCDDRLQELFLNVIEFRDCIILEGSRSKATQDKYFREGRSKVQWPNSKHNTEPSCAVDVAPYFAESPHVRWNDSKSFYEFAGFVQGVAATMDPEIRLRWGGDWDSDLDFHDQTFMDLVHFELLET